MSVFHNIIQKSLSSLGAGSHGPDALRPVIRQTIRVLISVATAWGVGTVLHLQETIWALVTALIVTQSSISQTMTTARDQIRGTLIGAVAGTCAVFLEMATGLLWVPFWIALVPLVFMTAIQPTLRFACITLMIVYLFPSHGSPFLPMVTRLTAIVIGVVVSIVVSFCVLHSSARIQALLTSGALLRQLDYLLKGALDPHTSWPLIEAQYEECVTLLKALEDAVGEARREGLASLEKRDPVLAALPKLMRRLLTDTMLVARAIASGRADGNKGLLPLYKGLSHALRALAYSSEEQAKEGLPKDKGNEADQGILNLLPRLEEQTRPEIRFVMSLIREDIEAAVGVVMRQDAEAINTL